LSSLRSAAPIKALWLARGSYGVLFLTTAALLGGFHPTDRTRDAVVVVTAAVVLAMNAPLVAWVLRAFRAPEHRRAAVLALVALVLRLCFAAWLLRFVATISHEGRG